jgi:hypothetical protein
MTYTPGIPNATDNISVSQGQVKTNFQQLETIFNNDHYTWDDATSGGAFRGFQRQISFPAALVSDPPLAGFSGYLFLKQDGNDTSLRSQVYFKNITATYQVTNRFQAATNPGYAMVNGGIIYMWGNIAETSSGNHPVAFPAIANYNYIGPGFPNNVFNVQFSIMCDTSAGAPIIVLDETAPPNTAGFNIRVSASVPNTSIYWFAVGN